MSAPPNANCDADCLRFLRSSGFSEQDIATARQMIDSLTSHDGAGPPDDFIKKDLMSVYAYYKGTAFPVIEGFDSPDHWEERKGEYQNVLVEGVRAGYSLEDQGKDYKKQMDAMEGCLNKHSKGTPAGTMSKGVLAKTCSELGLDIKEFQQYWYMNVHNLLKLKVIEDNDLFGFLIMGSPTNGCQYASEAQNYVSEMLPKGASAYTMSDHDPTIKAIGGGSCLPKGHSATMETGDDFMMRKDPVLWETAKAASQRMRKEKKKNKNNKKK